MKVLFLGLGGVGQRHMRNLRELVPDAEIGAVRRSGRTFEIRADMQADRSVNIMEKYRIQALPGLDEGIAWRPDLAVVASPTSAHVAQTAALAQARIPVLLEKPISAGPEGLTELLEVVSAKKTPVMVGYMMRFHPGVRRLLEWVERRAIGRLFSVQIQLSSFVPAWHPYESCTDFYAGRQALGGGAILSEIHELDLLHKMFGLPRRLWTVGGQLSDYGMDVEDTVSVLLEYEWEGAPLPVTVNMSFVQRPIGRRVDLWGAEGKIAWDFMAGELDLFHEESGKKDHFATPDFERNQMFLAELEHFIDCLAKGVQPQASLAEVIGGHRLALKIKESLERGEMLAFAPG
jgi:predicted dehydrogenase